MREGLQQEVMWRGSNRNTVTPTGGKVHTHHDPIIFLHTCISPHYRNKLVTELFCRIIKMCLRETSGYSWCGTLVEILAEIPVLEECPGGRKHSSPSVLKPLVSVPAEKLDTPVGHDTRQEVKF